MMGESSPIPDNPSFETSIVLNDKGLSRRNRKEVLEDVYRCVQAHRFPSSLSQMVCIFDGRGVEWIEGRMLSLLAFFEDLDMTPD